MIQFSVLPSDILQSLSITLDKETGESRGNLGLSYLYLPHPRTGLPSLYLPFETPNASKILEVQAVAPPNERSWFLDEEIVSDGRLLLMTPVDPAFFFIYMLQPAQQTDSTSNQFRPADDILEDVAASIEAASRPKTGAKESDKDPTISKNDILRFASMPCSRDALKSVCDIKEITTEIVVFRYSQTKVIDYLRTKVERLASPKISECSRTIVRSLARDGLMEDGNEQLLQLGRTRAACELLSQYLPQAIRAQLDQSYDYTKLDDYLQKSAAVMPMAPPKGLKKTTSTEGPADSKKRKNAKGSQGVEKLKKVSVKGMAKLSDLFQKKAPAA